MNIRQANLRPSCTEKREAKAWAYSCNADILMNPSLFLLLIFIMISCSLHNYIMKGSSEPKQRKRRSGKK
jgi:hypothetical protein